MAAKWIPVTPSDSLTEFMEQGALVFVEQNDDGEMVLGVFRRGRGAKVLLPAHVRLCRLVEDDAPVVLMPDICATMQDALEFWREDVETNAGLPDERRVLLDWSDAALDWVKVQRPQLTTERDDAKLE